MGRVRYGRHESAEYKVTAKVKKLLNSVRAGSSSNAIVNRTGKRGGGRDLCGTKTYTTQKDIHSLVLKLYLDLKKVSEVKGEMTQCKNTVRRVNEGGDGRGTGGASVQVRCEGPSGTS